MNSQKHPEHEHKAALAAWTAEAEAALDSLKKHLIHGGISSQTQMHARLEDLQGLLTEMRTLGAGLDAESRADVVRLLERMQGRFGAVTQVMDTLRGWAKQRLQAVAEDGSYRPYGEEHGDSGHRGRAVRNSAFEGALG